MLFLSFNYETKKEEDLINNNKNNRIFQILEKIQILNITFLSNLRSAHILLRNGHRSMLLQ